MKTDIDKDERNDSWIVRQTSFAKTFVIMSIIVFVVAFVFCLFMDNSIRGVSYTDILRILGQAAVSSAILLFVFYYLLKYWYIKIHSKDIADEGKEVNNSGSFGQKSFAKISFVAGIILFVIFSTALLFRIGNITTISGVDILRTLGISAVAAVGSLFLFWYFPTKAIFNLYNVQTEADYLKSKERIIGTFIVGSFLIFLLSVFLFFGFWGLDIWGHITELTDEAADEILYSKILYGIILFLAGEILLFLYLKRK